MLLIETVPRSPFYFNSVWVILSISIVINCCPSLVLKFQVHLLESVLYFYILVKVLFV